MLKFNSGSHSRNRLLFPTIHFRFSVTKMNVFSKLNFPHKVFPQNCFTAKLKFKQTPRSAYIHTYI